MRASAKKQEDSRNKARTSLRLRVIAMADEFGTHQGFVRDISLSGTSLYLDRSPQNIKSIRLQIAVPPRVVKEKPRVIEVSGKIIYTVYESYELGFRSGISFIKFINESDQEYLQSRLA